MSATFAALDNEHRGERLAGRFKSLRDFRRIYFKDEVLALFGYAAKVAARILFGPSANLYGVCCDFILPLGKKRFLGFGAQHSLSDAKRYHEESAVNRGSKLAVGVWLNRSGSLCPGIFLQCVKKRLIQSMLGVLLIDEHFNISGQRAGANLQSVLTSLVAIKVITGHTVFYSLVCLRVL